MTVREMATQLKLDCIAGESGLERGVKGVYIGDVLSVAMAHAKEGEVWMTVQGHMNVLAVAVLVNIPAIIFVHNVQVSDEMKKVAQEEGITLFSTSRRSYEMAKELVNAL